MNNLAEALSNLFSLLKMDSPCERDLRVTNLCMLLYLKKYGEVEALLKDASSKTSWDDVCAAVEIIHGTGFVYTQHGISKSLSAWKEDRQRVIIEKVVSLLAQVSEGFGVSAYFTSGTLLGLVRENRLIPHDDDIDSAYVSRAHDYLNWALEWKSLATFLSRQPGCSSECHLPGLLHITVNIDEKSSVRFDLFSSLVEGDYLNEYPLCTDVLRIDCVEPVSKAMLLGVEVPVPAVQEELLRVNYGEGWRVPDPTFRFDWDAAGKQYAKRIIGMSRAVPRADWIREQLPVLPDIQSQTKCVGFSESQIDAMEAAFSRSDGQPVVMFGVQGNDLVLRARQLAQAKGCPLCIVDFEVSGSESCRACLPEVELFPENTDVFIGSAELITAHLKALDIKFGTVYVGTYGRERTRLACETLNPFLSNECFIVFDYFILEVNGKISSGQYEALLHDDGLEGMALKALGRTPSSQVVMHATKRIVANHLI